MAKKQTTRKVRKPAKAPAKRSTRTTRITRAPRTPQLSADASALSVTDGEMKDVIRSAFLRRES